MVQFIATVREGPEDISSDSWKRSVSDSDMKKYFSDYPSHLQKALAIAIGTDTTIDCMRTFEHLPANTYAKGHICVVGDAAHATTPWQGSGGGISIEDALILSSLIGRITSRRNIPVALKVYDELRRPRTQQVVASSKGTGMIFTGQDSDVPMTFAGLHGKLRPRWDFILDFDNRNARDEALDLLDSRLQT